MNSPHSRLRLDFLLLPLFLLRARPLDGRVLGQQLEVPSLVVLQLGRVARLLLLPGQVDLVGRGLGLLHSALVLRVHAVQDGRAHLGQLGAVALLQLQVNHAAPKKTRREIENSTQFASPVTSFVDLEDSLAPVTPPTRGSPSVRMDPQLLYARVRRAHRGFALSFDGSAKTEKHGGYGCCAWILRRLSEWNIVIAASAYLETTMLHLADYTGMNNGVSAALEHGAEDLVIVGDSRLSIQQSLECNGFARANPGSTEATDGNGSEGGGDQHDHFDSNGNPSKPRATQRQQENPRRPLQQDAGAIAQQQPGDPVRTLRKAVRPNGNALVRHKFGCAEQAGIGGQARQELLVRVGRDFPVSERGNALGRVPHGDLTVNRPGHPNLQYLLPAGSSTRSREGRLERSKASSGEAFEEQPVAFSVEAEVSAFRSDPVVAS
ncbi:hypothetical protein ON010_g11981 [Phytophthora cinnamomi]|nr:hypothetical protein ON010_g11981 [Phytophthora cinnamomi]